MYKNVSLCSTYTARPSALKQLHNAMSHPGMLSLFAQYLVFTSRLRRASGTRISYLLSKVSASGFLVCFYESCLYCVFLVGFSRFLGVSSLLVSGQFLEGSKLVPFVFRLVFCRFQVSSLLVPGQFLVGAKLVPYLVPGQFLECSKLVPYWFQVCFWQVPSQLPFGSRFVSGRF